MSTLTPFIVSVETSAGNFDSAGLYSSLKSLASSKVWNFMTGVYIFKSEHSDVSISKTLQDEHFPPHIVAKFDPKSSSGVFAQSAWDSYFLDIFYDDLEEIGFAKGWDIEMIGKIKKVRRESK